MTVLLWQRDAKKKEEKKDAEQLCRMVCYRRSQPTLPAAVLESCGTICLCFSIEKRTRTSPDVVYSTTYLCVYLTHGCGPQRARLPIPSTATSPSCLWSRRILSSLPGARLTIFYRDASSELLQLVNQRLNFTYSRSHAFRYGRQNRSSAFLKNRTNDFRTTGCTWLPTRPLGRPAVL